MKTRIVTVSEDALTGAAKDTIAEAGRIIQNGGLVAFPTETVYGLGGNAFDPDAARRIYEAKGRPSDNPLIVHIAEAEDLERVARSVPKAAYRLAEAFWPGPLTMILDKRPCVPDTVTGGLATVAVRLPSLTIARELIRAAGGFVAAPSANASGRPSPTLAAHCIEDLDGRVDMIIDGGAAVLGLESTVLDLTVPVPAILRPGFVTGEMIEHVLDVPVVSPEATQTPDDTAPKAPGMKYRHYAPRGRLCVVTGAMDAVSQRICTELQEAREEGRRTGVICARQQAEHYTADVVRCYGEQGDVTAFAGALFKFLREMDAEGAEVICAEGTATEGVGTALMNRLVKAAGGNVVEV